jgi:hypothetical protein
VTEAEGSEGTLQDSAESQDLKYCRLATGPEFPNLVFWSFVSKKEQGCSVI